MATATITALHSHRITLASLPPEPWGARFARARESRGLTIRDIDSLGLEFGRGVAHKLEQLASAPTNPRDRRRALTLLVVYGIDPADFDLNDEDVPPVLDLHALRDLGIRQRTWNGDHDYLTDAIAA